jgi:hypothetical protein
VDQHAIDVVGAGQLELVGPDGLAAVLEKVALVAEDLDDLADVHHEALLGYARRSRKGGQNAMNGSKQGGFSMGWVLVSYFMICGGFVLTAVAFGLAKVSGEWTGYAIFGIGAFVGGFFAGRASPHSSVIEPAIGGVLMILTIIGFFAATPLGQIMYDVAKDEVIKQSIILGGIALVGGLGGALLGEKTTGGGGPSRSGFRWLGISTLINFGTMFAAIVVIFTLMIRDAVSAAESGLEKPTMDGDAAATAFFLALAVAAFVGGLVTQAAAPARMLLGAGLGAAVAIAGVGLLAVSGVATSTGGDVESKAMGQALGGIAIMAAGAAIIGVIGAAIGWAVVRNSKAAA